MVALDAVRLLPADVELPLRDQIRIGLPPVRTVEPWAPARLHPGEKTLAGSSVTTAQLPVDDPARSPIPGLPDPELAGLFLTSCHLSSSSITTAPPSRPGFSAWALAKRSLHS